MVGNKPTTLLLQYTRKLQSCYSYCYVSQCCIAVISLSLQQFVKAMGNGIQGCQKSLIPNLI